MSSPIQTFDAASVLIVDDCPLIRYGFKQVLACHCRCANLGEASRAEALAFLRMRDWTVVVLGVSPHEGGLELMRSIRELRESPRIVVLSNLVEAPYAWKALRAGAAGFLLKQDPVCELVRGLQLVLAGRQYVSTCVRAKMSPDGAKLQHENLSQRESTVFLGLAGGKRITDIAAEMKVNAKTVSTYRHRVLLKMGLGCDADIVAYTIRHGLRNSQALSIS